MDFIKIEFACNGIPSGICKCWADENYNVIDELNYIYNVPTEYILQLFMDGKQHDIIYEGPENNRCCYLFKKELFKSYMI